MNYKRPVLGEHLAFLSVKYSVYLTELFEAIVSARTAGEAICEGLEIQYRGSVADEAIILIKKEDKVVMQFRVAEELLLRKNIDFESWMDTDKIRRQKVRQDGAQSGSAEPNRIMDLRHGMRKVNVEVEVIELAKPMSLHTQYGNSVVLTNASVADQSGKIRLCLWNEQADLIKEGDVLRIEGASVATFRGERQLRLGKKGTITKMQMPIPNLYSGSSENPRGILYT